MNRGKKTIRRGGTSNQVQVHQSTRNRPITRKQSTFLCEEDRSTEPDEKFVLIELTLNKKLLIVKFHDLIKLNKQVKIKLGTHVLVKTNVEQSTSASVFCIGSKQQCLDELHIIKVQRDNKENLNCEDTVDDGDDPPLVITTILTGSTQKQPVRDRKTNIHELTTSGIYADTIQIESNLCSSSLISSPITEPSPSHPVSLNYNQNVTLAASSLTSSIGITTPPHKTPLLSIHTNAIKPTSDLQCGRMDPLSDLITQLTNVTKDRDYWKDKFLAMETRYLELENVSIMIPTDDNVCEWICTVYDVIQRQVNSDVNYDEESKKLNMSPDLLKYCVKLSKPPTITARNLFQYVCLDELTKGTSWLGIPTSKIDAIHVFGEKLFGRLKWNRKNIKISLQNFIRSERANLKRDPHQDDLNEQAPDHNGFIVDELVPEHIE